VLTNFIPEMGILDQAYLWKNADEAHAAVDGKLGDLIKEKAEALGLHIIGFEESGFRNTFSTKPIQTMADYTVTEAQIENLVIAKGYTDCVAFIGEDALSLAVAAPEGGLTEADTAKIVDVVNQSSGFTADQIKIIEVE